MILSRHLRGSFYGNPFVIGTTDKNEYYPVYAAFNNENSLTVRNHNGKLLNEFIIGNIYLYKKPSIEAKNLNRIGNRYEDLYYFFEDSIFSNIYEFIYKNINHKLYVSKGYISDVNDNILLILCTNSTELFDNENNINTQHLKLFVSNQFILDEKYKNVFKRINSKYISYCYKNDIEVVFTTSRKIEEQVFKNNININFSSITELTEHLKNDVGKNLFFGENVDSSEEYPYVRI